MAIAKYWIFADLAKGRLHLTFHGMHVPWSGLVPVAD